MIEQKQHQDFHAPKETEDLSYYKYLVGVSNYDSKWQFEFIFSDGQRTGSLGNKNFVDYRI
jgi:hypothetical protein